MEPNSSELEEPVSFCETINHGLVAIGADMHSAFTVAEEIELIARIYSQAKSIGQPVLVDDAEMERVMDEFKTYGQ